MSFVIEDYDPDDPDVQAATDGICRHPDGDERDPHVISGVRADDDLQD